MTMIDQRQVIMMTIWVLYYDCCWCCSLQTIEKEEAFVRAFTCDEFVITIGLLNMMMMVIMTMSVIIMTVVVIMTMVCSSTKGSQGLLYHR